MSEQVISLRELQELIRPKAAGDEYLRGLFNGIDMALAVLGDMPFRPIFHTRLFGDKLTPAPEAPEPPKAPTRRRGGSKNAKLYAPDAPETPTAPATAEDQYDRLIGECKKRGYDPDLMLGMARVLPRISFRKSGRNLVPTLRRPKEDNEA